VSSALKHLGEVISSTATGRCTRATRLNKPTACEGTAPMRALLPASKKNIITNEYESSELCCSFYS
jgi:hypothetical protein